MTIGCVLSSRSAPVRLSRILPRPPRQRLHLRSVLLRQMGSLTSLTGLFEVERLSLLQNFIFFVRGLTFDASPGYLFKRGERNPAFKRRFFVLKKKFLYYFKSEEDMSDVSCIDLRDALRIDDASSFKDKVLYRRPGEIVALCVNARPLRLTSW